MCISGSTHTSIIDQKQGNELVPDFPVLPRSPDGARCPPFPRGGKLLQPPPAQCASQGLTLTPISSPPSWQRDASSPQKSRPQVAEKPSPASCMFPRPHRVSLCGRGPKASRGAQTLMGVVTFTSMAASLPPVQLDQDQDVSWAPIIPGKEEAAFLHWSKACCNRNVKESIDECVVPANPLPPEPQRRAWFCY